MLLLQISLVVLIIVVILLIVGLCYLVKDCEDLEIEIDTLNLLKTTNCHFCKDGTYYDVLGTPCKYKFCPMCGIELKQSSLDQVSKPNVFKELIDMLSLGFNHGHTLTAAECIDFRTDLYKALLFPTNESVPPEDVSSQKLYRKVYHKLHMRATRHEGFKHSFLKFKAESEEWKDQVSKKLQSEEDYICWLRIEALK